MKTISTMRSQALLTFVIPTLTAFAIFLSGCSKEALESEISPVDSKTTIGGESEIDFSVMASEFVINVKNQGAVGDGVTDDTWAFQRAIDKAADTAAAYGTTVDVFVPKGTYLIDPDISINMRSHVYLQMVDTQRILLAKPTASERYSVIRMVNVSNSRVIGGKIIGDRYDHLGSEGEWGMGIAIFGAWRAKVIGTHIVDCWGDGIVIGASNRSNAPNSSKRCVIENVVCDNNRRQALTIGTVDSLIVKNSTFVNTNGTPPEDGIDIEPDFGTAQRVHIMNCELGNNAGNGIEMNVRPTTTAVIKDIYVQDNYIYGNVFSGYVQHVDHVIFNNNCRENNQFNGVYRNDATNSVFGPNACP